MKNIFLFIFQFSEIEKKEKREKAENFYLEYDWTTIFKYKNWYVYMNQEDGTFLKETLPDNIEEWKRVPLDIPVEKLVQKQFKEIIYYDDQNIFDIHGFRMGLEDFLSEVFNDMKAPISDLSEKQKLKYDKRASNMAGLVFSIIPDLPKRADIDDCWGTELYQMDLRDYKKTNIFGTRLEKVFEVLKSEDILKEQLSKTFLTIAMTDVTPLSHYFSSIINDPNCWVPELLDQIYKRFRRRGSQISRKGPGTELDLVVKRKY